MQYFWTRNFLLCLTTFVFVVSYLAAVALDVVAIWELAQEEPGVVTAGRPRPRRPRTERWRPAFFLWCFRRGTPHEDRSRTDPTGFLQKWRLWFITMSLFLLAMLVLSRKRFRRFRLSAPLSNSAAPQLHMLTLRNQTKLRGVGSYDQNQSQTK